MAPAALPVPAATDEPPKSMPAVAQVDAAEVVTPAVLAARAPIEAVVPMPPAHAGTDPRAVALIVRYEITSPDYYAQRLQRPIWPGESSGVTWGVGYDGGHQTRARIAADWDAHPAVLRLVETSGITGPPARAVAAQLRDVATPYPMAEQVFAESTLPAYHALAARTFRDGWDRLPPTAQGSLTATVYNRGVAMAGDRRREMRVLRDVCVPAGDCACMAAQYRSMPRLWAGTAVADGLRARYEATARLAEMAP